MLYTADSEWIDHGESKDGDCDADGQPEIVLRFTKTGSIYIFENVMYINRNYLQKLGSQYIG